jgi:hypothetical protein
VRAPLHAVRAKRSISASSGLDRGREGSACSSAYSFFPRLPRPSLAWAPRNSSGARPGRRWLGLDRLGHGLLRLPNSEMGARRRSLVVSVGACGWRQKKPLAVTLDLASAFAARFHHAGCLSRPAPPAAPIRVRPSSRRARGTRREGPQAAPCAWASGSGSRVDRPPASVGRDSRPWPGSVNPAESGLSYRKRRYGRRRPRGCAQAPSRRPRPRGGSHRAGRRTRHSGVMRRSPSQAPTPGGAAKHRPLAFRVVSSS